MINKTKWYKGKCAYSIACRTPKFPSKLRSLFVNKYDDTIREKFAQRIEDMKTNEACVCGSGKSKKDCCKELNDDSVVAHLLKKLTFVDGMMHEEAVKRSVTFLCKKGCKDCCYEYFYISIAEYFALKYTLMKKNIFDEVVAKAKQQEPILLKKCAKEYEKLYDFSISKSAAKMFTDNEFINRFELCPCNVNGECVGYNARPFICRAYGTTRQFDVCDIAYDKIKNMLDNNVAQKELDKYILPIEFDMDFIQADNDVFEYNGNSLLSRPYPLVYWLCNDKNYIHLYDVAIHGKKDNFTKQLIK